MSAEPTNLPAVADPDPVRLLARYDEAKRAISECRTLAGCKQWSDKSAALRTYAKLANDDSLRVAALKFQAYAERRAGELLKEIEPSKGGRPSETQDAAGPSLTRERQDGGAPPLNRTQAAIEAGLSERQRKTALRLAAIPEKDFEAAVESENPPTITELAMRGTVSRPVEASPEPAPPDPAETAETQSALQAFAEFCREHDAASIAHAIEPADTEMLAVSVAVICRWLDRFITNLRQ